MSSRSLKVCAHRDRIGRVARHLVEGRVGDAHVELALPLAAPVRVAPLPLAQVVPVLPQPDECDSGRIVRREARVRCLWLRRMQRGHGLVCRKACALLGQPGTAQTRCPALQSCRATSHGVPAGLRRSYEARVGWRCKSG